MTLYEALATALDGARAYNRNDAVAPVALLWTDREEQWRPLIPRLRERFPLLTYGDYDPGSRTGPAIWIRCMLARALPEADWDADAIPVLYLPGVSRADFRAVESCPEPLQPLLELQYRGALWSQKNGKDWTVSALLQNAEVGLGIAVSGDEATRAALRRSLELLADVSVETLRDAAPLRADYLNGILDPDLTRAVLLWIDDPDHERSARSDEEWEAFRASCADRFGFDPDADGPVTAAGLLGSRDGAWESAWGRFAEAPARFPGIPDRLRSARPSDRSGLLAYGSRSSWPQENEEKETELRDALITLGDDDHARAVLRAAEDEHGERRGWVWAALGHAPLAEALPALLRLAEATKEPVSGASPEEMAAAYAESGWTADDAAMTTLACATAKADSDALRAAVETLYRPWLTRTAELFQRRVADHPIEAVSEPPEPKPGRCILFADALRCDAANRLKDRLLSQGFAVEIGWRFAALPSVTSTAKIAVSPVASRFGSGEGFAPSTESNAAASVAVLRKVLEEEGFAVLLGDDLGNPSGCAWTEAGQLDGAGHNEGWRLARRIDGEVRSIAERVSLLLEAGWKEIRIVTDHGWLLLPGGLPKADLPEHLTEIRKGRCARLKPDAAMTHQTVPWRWDPMVRIAVAPGISCYVAGKEYEHGGLSLQECVTPVLTVRRAGGSVPQAKVESVKWTGLRCGVKVSGEFAGCMLDLRAKANDPASSVLKAPKPFGAEGAASVAVPDDSLEGRAAILVVLGPAGEIVAQEFTSIGE